MFGKSLSFGGKAFVKDFLEELEIVEQSPDLEKTEEQ